MTVCRGKKNLFVGMNIEYSGNKQVSYINECIEAFGEAVTTGESILAARYLFEVDDKKGVHFTLQDFFNHILEILLFVSIVQPL